MNKSAVSSIVKPAARIIFVAVAVVLSALVLFGCSEEEDEYGTTGSSTGSVMFKNESAAEAMEVTLTRTSDGSRVGYYYGPVKASTGIHNFGSTPTGLLKISISGRSGGTTSHNFTLSAGEQVTLTFTSNSNWVVKRSGGGNSGGGEESATGYIRVTNNSGYALNYVMISQNNVVSTNESGFAKGDVWRWKAPVGTNTVSAGRPGSTYMLKWSTTVTVREGQTAEVSIPSTGWAR